MTYKKSVLLFIIFSFLTLIFLPIVNGINTLLYSEKKISEMNKKSLFNTDVVESYINYFGYRVLKQSFVSDKVIVGKNDFFFLGNFYSQVLDKTIGKFRPSVNEIEQWVNQLENLQKWYESQGIKFLYVIAPDKHYVYKEYLPENLNYKGKTITDDIVENAEKKNLNILDLRPILLKQKVDNQLLYHKADTHWNEYGASIAYEATINKLNSLYNIQLNRPQYSIEKTKEGGGDLTNFLKITHLIEPNNDDYLVKPMSKDEMCIGNIDIKDKQMQECKIETNRNIYINGQPQYTINQHALNNNNLLWLCDSFGTANSKLYNLSFKKIFKFHNQHLIGSELSQFIDDNKPDIVIYQIVQRAVYDEQIFKINQLITKVKDLNTSMQNINFDLRNSDKYIKHDLLVLEKNPNYINLKISRDDSGIMILKNDSVTNKINYLYVNMDSSQDTTFQVYYKKNKNDTYQEENSYKVKIKKGNNKFTLKIDNILIDNNLRIDITKNVGSYKIYDFMIYSK